jgi:endonuclease/exonuclease/phosphatase family metal-dependent hydrolase
MLSKSRAFSLLMVTIAILFGLHFVRAFLESVIWYLGETLSPEILAVFALAIFAMALLLPLVRRIFGERGTLGLTVGGILVARLVQQIADDGLLHLIMATVGVVLWSWFLPFWHQSPRNRSEIDKIPVTLLALPLAFLIDTGSRTLLWDYDLAWRQGFWPMLIIVLIGAAGGYFLWVEIKSGFNEKSNDEPAIGRNLPFLGFGPFLCLAFSLFHNPSALVAATGWRDVQAQFAINLFVVMGALRLLWGIYWPQKRRWLIAIVCGAGLVVSLIFIVAGIGPGWLWFALGTLTLWGSIGVMLMGTARRAPLKPGLWRSSLGMFLALLILLVTIFLVAQFEMVWMTVAAGVIGLITGVWAAVGDTFTLETAAFGRLMRVGGVVGVVLIVIAGFWTWNNYQIFPEEQHHAGQPIRVMTYNIHQGVDADMKMDLEAIVAAILAEQPDILVLNEVNRNRATNGYTEVLSLISEKTGMPYIFGNNYADGQYGNALLTKLPILEWENLHFEHNTTETRGVFRVVVETASGPLTLYATHLDHIASPDDVRFEQVAEILSVWDHSPRVILLGDMNATPETPEIQQIYTAGFVSVLEAAGQADTFTFWNQPPVPGYRIDHIFVTSDLEIGDTWVSQTRASDHLPVIVVIYP